MHDVAFTENGQCAKDFIVLVDFSQLKRTLPSTVLVLGDLHVNQDRFHVWLLLRHVKPHINTRNMIFVLYFCYCLTSINYTKKHDPGSIPLSKSKEAFLISEKKSDIIFFFSFLQQANIERLGNTGMCNLHEIARSQITAEKIKEHRFG